ncbi:STAS domain-containing protein [Lentibacillus sp. CBA3610]|uniref:STAS domain-containing protein n=1 Tax=Lentibacillus sp. CBA3610 TaxID=2518176 RepID=UPI0015960E26|nr:STAS domain-containing protein [Lentibacillus sp. CBA3610]QKY71215.1 anti-sigma factor antagonist [Lentibacillus sp. CBA3610]
MDLKIDITEGIGKSTVKLFGEIDAYTAPQLKEKLLPLTKIERNQVEVNLENVHYMDSTGLGVFISALKSTKENNSELRLVDLQDRVLRLFRITGLDEIITIDTAIRGGNN